MDIENTPLKDCFIIKPKIHKDHRGIFFETFNEKDFREASGITTPFVQDNQSCSTRGVLRGLHFQTGEMAQAKLVRVAKGEVLDVVVDLRKDSESFGKSFWVVLNDENHWLLYVPRGFAHGFVTLSETAVFCYKCDNFYHKESESGIVYNDATLSIDWHLSEEELIVVERDLELPTYEEAIR